MLLAESLNLPELVKELTGLVAACGALVTAIGVIVLGVLQVKGRWASNANSTEIKKKLDKQDVVLETFRVDAVETAAKAVEVKQATEDVKQAAEVVTRAASEVKSAAVEVAKASHPTGNTSQN